AIFVYIFKGTKEIIGVIITKGKAITTAVNESVFSSEAIIKPIKGFLFLFNSFLTVILQLVAYKIIYALPQLHHSLNSFLCPLIGIWLYHARVFTVVYFTVYKGIGKVLNFWVSRDGCISI